MSEKRLAKKVHQAMHWECSDEGEITHVVGGEDGTVGKEQSGYGRGWFWKAS